MRRKLLYPLLALWVVTTAVAACSTQTFDVFIEEGTPTPNATPTGFEGIPPFGTGIDGELVVDGGTDVAINVCHQISAVSGSSLTFIGSVSDFNPGGLLLLLQERDDILLPPPARAGTFELVRLLSVNSASLTAVTENPIAHVYDTAGSTRAQACTVPEYTKVTVEGIGVLRAADRTNVIGGVLAFLVSTSMSLESASLVTADAAGLPGGKCDGNSALMISDDPGDTQGGSKGEGLQGTGEGRGRKANAGGGGNPVRAGAGGGGNGGAGGRGGGAATDDTRGFGEGGNAIAFTTTRGGLLFGAGGGGAHSSGGEDSPCAGGQGGGVIFLQTALARGTGEVRAAGESLLDIADLTTGGGGGGGAGGTIWLIVGTDDDFTPLIGAPGGRGGDAAGAPAAGPGGGGGGGFVHLGGFASMALDLSGGATGSSPAGPRGAAVGTSGTTF